MLLAKGSERKHGAQLWKPRSFALHFIPPLPTPAWDGPDLTITRDSATQFQTHIMSSSETVTLQQTNKKTPCALKTVTLLKEVKEDVNKSVESYSVFWIIRLAVTKMAVLPD